MLLKQMMTTCRDREVKYCFNSSLLTSYRRRFCCICADVGDLRTCPGSFGLYSLPFFFVGHHPDFTGSGFRGIFQYGLKLFGHFSCSVSVSSDLYFFFIKI